jgi:ParB-like chromosome segregation protein Spo0J
MAKPKVMTLPIEKLVEDFNFYPRHSVDSTTVSHYADAMKAGAVFPPIRVDAKSLRVIDGFHRLAAHRRAGINEILVSLEETADEADFFERAIVANSAHGHRYSPFDHARILLRAKELGLEREKVAVALQVSPVRLEEIERGFAHSETQSVVPLKRTIAHMADREMSPAQIEANNKLGGMKQTFYVNQVILLLENDLVNVEDKGLVSRLETLTALLNDFNKKALAA